MDFRQFLLLFLIPLFIALILIVMFPDSIAEDDILICVRITNALSICE